MKSKFAPANPCSCCCTRSANKHVFFYPVMCQGAEKDITATTKQCCKHTTLADIQKCAIKRQSTPLWQIFKNALSKDKSFIQNRMRAQWVLKSGEQCYIKATSNIQKCMSITTPSEALLVGPEDAGKTRRCCVRRFRSLASHSLRAWWREWWWPAQRGTAPSSPPSGTSLSPPPAHRYDRPLYTV